MNATAKINDADHMGTLLAGQRAAFLRDGVPSLAHRRADLAKLKQALLGRRWTARHRPTAPSRMLRGATSFRRFRGLQATEPCQRHL